MDWMTICIYLMLVSLDGSAYVEPAMIMVRLIFLSFDTRAGKTVCMDSVALWGSDLS